MKHYSINEIFYSLQGEGVRAGTANVFVRFAGCNLECQMAAGPKSPGGFDCDTEFAGGRPMTLEELIAEMERRGGRCRQTILTGGEPLLQVDHDLVEALKARGWFIAVETNGTKAISTDIEAIDWVTVSPKVAEHAVQVSEANEVKYVRYDGQALPKPYCCADHYLLSPAFTSEGVDQASLRWCIELIKKHPEWRLSTQLHKVWRVR